MGIAEGIIGGGLLGLGGSMYGSKKSADAMGDASKKASQTELEMYYQSREDAAPWRETGENALRTLFGGETTYGLPEPKKEDFMTAAPNPVVSQKYNQDMQRLQELERSQRNEPERDSGVERLRSELQQKYGDMFQADEAPPSIDQEAYDKAYQKYLDSGVTSEGMVQKGPGEFVPEDDPGYKYGYQEFVEKPLLRQGAAGGRLGGGRASKELTRYASDYASTKYDDFLNRWYQSLAPYQSAAGIGQSTALQMGSNALATGQMLGQNALAAGGAQANAYGQMGSAISQFAGGMGQNALDYYYMNKYMQPTGTTGAAAGGNALAPQTNAAIASIRQT